MLPRTLITMLAVSFAGSFLVTVGTAQDADVPKKPIQDISPAKDKPPVNEQRVAELTALIRDQPDKADGYRMRAFEYARGEDWDKAAADFLHIAQLEKGGSQLAQKIGVFLVLGQDKKTHKQLCKEMLEVFSRTNKPGDWERTAKICTLMPEPPGDLEKLLKLSKQSVEFMKDDSFAVHHLRTLALVLLRMKKYDEAIDAVRRGDEVNDAANWKMPNVIICNRAIEAMCLAQRGKRDEAKKVLAKATPKLEKQFQHQTLLYQDEFWHDWLIAKVLHDEAQELLAETKP